MSTKLGEHLFRTRLLARAELVRRTPQRLVKAGAVCVVKAVALICRDELNLRTFRQVDGLVEQEPSPAHPSLERQRHAVSLGMPRATCNRSVPGAEASNHDPRTRQLALRLSSATFSASRIFWRESAGPVPWDRRAHVRPLR
jgi:hypothetical protein